MLSEVVLFTTVVAVAAVATRGMSPGQGSDHEEFPGNNADFLRMSEEKIVSDYWNSPAEGVGDRICEKAGGKCIPKGNNFKSLCEGKGDSMYKCPKRKHLCCFPHPVDPLEGRIKHLEIELQKLDTIIDSMQLGGTDHLEGRIKHLETEHQKLDKIIDSMQLGGTDLLECRIKNLETEHQYLIVSQEIANTKLDNIIDSLQLGGSHCPSNCIGASSGKVGQCLPVGTVAPSGTVQEISATCSRSCTCWVTEFTKCSSPWVSLGSSGCFLFVRKKSDCDSARSYCNDNGADLAIIDVESSQDDMMNYLKSEALSNNYFYVGGNDHTRENSCLQFRVRFRANGQGTFSLGESEGYEYYSICERK